MSARDAEFTGFARRVWDALARPALLLTGSNAAAEDLLQETLLRCYLAWTRIEPATGVAYARRTMANLAVDGWRRRRILEVADGVDHGVPAGESRVDDRDEIVRELAGLSPRERTVLVLRYYADLTETAVAAELGISVGTVKSTTARALGRLRSRGERLSPGGVR